MKQDLSLQELAQKVAYVGEFKRDLIVPAEHLSFDIDRQGVRVNSGQLITRGNVTEHAFTQVTTDLGIPAT
jgi:hypothetical protein